jgi:hypothetical protein
MLKNGRGYIFPRGCRLATKIGLKSLRKLKNVVLKFETLYWGYQNIIGVLQKSFGVA